MQLNELLDKEGLESVSQKTNISLENLENLKNRAFEKLNRVKSLGFVAIIEREYEMELSDLKSEIKSYFDDHHSAKDDEVVMISPDRTEESGSGLFKWLVVLAVLYALWYLYSEGKFGSISNASNTKETALEDNKALESNVSQEVAKNIVVNTEENTPVVSIDTQKKTPESVPQETNEVMTLVETPESLSAAAEGNITQLAIAQKRQEQAKKEVVEEATPTPESVVQEQVVASADVPEEVTTEVTPEDKPQTIRNLTINPTRGMLWYGFINVDSKKRKEFMNKVSTPFELNNGRWILVTGHGYLEIVSDLGTVKVTKNIRKKHYFYLDSKEIKEISRKEFRELNGNRGW